MAGKWDCETTLKFIKLYKSHPCLWDFSLVEYKDKQKRDAAYISITEEMNIPDFSIQDTKNKIKNLRSTYSQEIKKMQESMNSEESYKSVYISNIKWLHEMEEVFAKNLKKQVFENTNQTNNEVTESEASECEVWWPHETPISIEVPPATSTSTIGKIPRVKKRTREIVKAISSLKKEVNCANNSEVDTQWDAFGKSVAMQLKNMSVDNALLAQCQLQSILTEFGVKNHREKVALGSVTSKKHCVN